MKSAHILCFQHLQLFILSSSLPRNIIDETRKSRSENRKSAENLREKRRENANLSETETTS